MTLDRWLENKEREWEALCANCGACCGALEDPCANLVKDPKGRFSCRDYAGRLGLQTTVRGQLCKCVPIREKLGTSWPGDEHCGYKKLRRE